VDLISNGRGGLGRGNESLVAVGCRIARLLADRLFDIYVVETRVAAPQKLFGE